VSGRELAPAAEAGRNGRRPPPASLPVLLLPVRVELRFERDGAQPELWVRIFPDQISIDSHDPRVTDAEIDATTRYWETLWRAGTADQAAASAAWASLAQRFGATRAAYLVHSQLLTPANLAARPADPTPDGAPLTPPPAFPTVDAADRRPAAWSSAPVARGLPERWTVTLVRDGAVVRRAVSAPVTADIAVGPDPSSPRAPTADDLAIDEGMRWMVDFDEAVTAGMGLRVPLDEVDMQVGFDRLFVHGVDVSAAPHGPDVLRRLLEAHRFTDGLALVPQGTPTNNTADAAAGYTRSDPGFARSFALEAGPPATMHDGEAFADLLGLPHEAVERIESAGRTDQLNGRAMTLALWPATLGYFLEQILSEVVGKGVQEDARTYVLETVRGRGHVPAFRVGQTPYGVLPTTSLERFRRDRGPVAATVADGLRRLWPVWQASAVFAPHIQRGGDHDAQLVGILGMDASARAYRMRHAIGEEFLMHAVSWLDVGGEREYDFVTAPAKAELAQLGYAFDSRLSHLALSKVDHPVPFPTVDDRPLSENDGLPAVPLPDGSTGNYVSWLRHASLAAVEADEESFPGGKPPDTLLYKVLRHSVLTEYSRVTWRILIGAGVDGSFARERELVGFELDRRAGRPTIWQALQMPMPGLTGPTPQTIASHIADQVVLRMPDYSRLWELYDALDWLAGLPTAELDRLFTETLDTYSHRIDPWVTSLAIALDRERRGDAPRAFHIGAYGWLEDVRPDAPPSALDGLLAERVRQVDELRRSRHPTAPAPRPARLPDEDNAGFVHAPSLAQAETAAVLRSGYLTHRDSSGGDLLALDVSSQRTRIALDFLDGIRQGQPLAALLGYRFERALTAAGLQVFVQPFRDNFPLVANRLTEPAGSVEAVAAANVVDGVALHAAWKSGSLWSLPLGPSPTQRAAVDGFVADLDDVLDALGDLSIAESVYQIMRGNPVKAGGLIDAIARGERPPDPEVVRTPRGGIDVTHRIVLLFVPAASRAPGWPGSTHPRAVAEPRLDAWVSRLLPAPSHVRCRVEYRRPSAPDGDVTVRLADLDVGPLDVIALADATGEEQAAELERRVLYHAQTVAPPDATDFELVFAPEAGWGPQDRSFPQLLTVGQSISKLLAGARALTPQDLSVPERDALADGASLDNVELATRAAAAIASVGSAAVALDGATTASALRAALLAGSLYGVVGAVPDSGVGADPQTVAALGAQAAPVAAELHRRQDKAQADDAAFDRPTASPAQLRDHLVGLLHTVFGDGFVICPRFTPPAPMELAGAFAASSSLLDGDRDVPERWLTQLAYVRAGVDRFGAARDGAQLIAGRYPPALELAQLPPRSPDRWLALALVPGAAPPPSGRVSIAAEIHPVYAAAQPHSGLMLDEWPERIPAAAQSTGLAFHYDQPNARPPQALLLAVNPEPEGEWDDDALETILGETLDLAKARTVDLESITALGQLLPTLLFPFNADGETVSLGFEDIR
jgi:hypothetical protein